MAYLIDNEPVYSLQPLAVVSGNQQFSPFAFALELPFEELPADQSEQFQKIVKSVQQEVANTCLLLNYQNWSLYTLRQRGVKNIIVFSAQPISQFQSIQVAKHKAFTISGIHFFIVSDLSAFQKNDNEKKILWGFLKAKLA